MITKLYLSTLIIVCFISCKKHEKIEPDFRIEHYLDSVKKNDSLKIDNTVMRESVNKNFQQNLITQVNNGLFNDFPLLLTEVKECDGKYYLEFENYYNRNTFKKSQITFNINNLKVDFTGSVTKEIAYGLTENKLYLVEFKFVEYLNLNNYEKYCKSFLWSPFIGVEKGFGNFGNIEFGEIAIKIDSVKLYNEMY